jgi:hypothetical protein
MDLCYKSSNNQYNNSPPRMNDGRHFTDYRSNCLINNLINKNNNHMRSHDLKNFLINNANKLREINRTYVSQKNGVNNCNNFVDIQLKHRVVCNKNTCRKVLVNPEGFGIDVQYNSNLKSNNLNRYISPNDPNNNCVLGIDNYRY